MHCLRLDDIVCFTEKKFPDFLPEWFPGCCSGTSWTRTAPDVTSQDKRLRKVDLGRRRERPGQSFRRSVYLEISFLLNKCLKTYLNFKSQISSGKVLGNRIKIFESKKRRGILYLEVLVFSNKHKLFDVLKFNLKLLYQMIQSKGSLKLYLANLVRTKRK